MAPLTQHPLKDLLRNHGVRPSIHRVRILEYMQAIGGHPTADEVYKALASELPSLSKATVYNTLHTFVEAGVLRDLAIDQVEIRYDVMTENHGHFRCDNCQTIYNFQVNFDQIMIMGEGEFEVTERNIYFKGLCPACVKQKKGS